MCADPAESCALLIKFGCYDKQTPQALVFWQVVTQNEVWLLCVTLPHCNTLLSGPGPTHRSIWVNKRKGQKIGHWGRCAHFPSQAQKPSCNFRNSLQFFFRLRLIFDCFSSESLSKQQKTGFKWDTWMIYTACHFIRITSQICKNDIFVWFQVLLVKDVETLLTLAQVYLYFTFIDA